MSNDPFGLGIDISGGDDLFGIGGFGNDNKTIEEDNSQQRTYTAAVQATGKAADYFYFKRLDEVPLPWNFAMDTRLEGTERDDLCIYKSFDYVNGKIVDDRYTSCTIVQGLKDVIRAKIRLGDIQMPMLNELLGEKRLGYARKEVKRIEAITEQVYSDQKLEQLTMMWTLTGFVRLKAPLMQGCALIGVPNEDFIEFIKDMWETAYHVVVNSNIVSDSGKTFALSDCNMMTYEQLNKEIEKFKTAKQSGKAKKANSGADILDELLGL